MKKKGAHRDIKCKRTENRKFSPYWFRLEVDKGD